MRPNNYRPIILVLFLIAIIRPLQAFEGYSPIGARSAAMGYASVSLTDFWSIQNNPAGMADYKHFAAGIAYQNRYLMQALALKSAAVIAPTKLGVLGVSFNQFGYNLYSENKIGLAYARSFGKVLRLGLQLDYLSTHIAEGYENANAITFEFGAQSQINDKLTVGAYIFNPIKARLSSYTDERIPVVLRFGLSYLFTPELLGTAEIEKNFDNTASIRGGLEYFVLQKFYVRAGLVTNPNMLSFGAGYDIGPASIDIAAGVHQVLGSTIQASLIFNFGMLK
ncbi:MAG: hypothetical protein PF694_02350 [Bacteroidetes bacterium]|jgi:hypothetical protein|nr:hypothetical protein [Bacteroidota bacterium]